MNTAMDDVRLSTAFEIDLRDAAEFGADHSVSYAWPLARTQNMLSIEGLGLNLRVLDPTGRQRVAGFRWCQDVLVSVETSVTKKPFVLMPATMFPAEGEILPLACGFVYAAEDQITSILRLPSAPPPTGSRTLTIYLALQGPPR